MTSKVFSDVCDERRPPSVKTNQLLGIIRFYPEVWLDEQLSHSFSSQLNSKRLTEWLLHPVWPSVWIWIELWHRSTETERWRAIERWRSCSYLGAEDVRNIMQDVEFMAHVQSFRPRLTPITIRILKHPHLAISLSSISTSYPPVQLFDVLYIWMSSPDALIFTSSSLKWDSCPTMKLWKYEHLPERQLSVWGEACSFLILIQFFI